VAFKDKNINCGCAAVSPHPNPLPMAEGNKNLCDDRRRISFRFFLISSAECETLITLRILAAGSSHSSLHHIDYRR